jgi:hypothetical protein
LLNRSHTLEVIISCPQNYGLRLAETLIPWNIHYSISWHFFGIILDLTTSTINLAKVLVFLFWILLNLRNNEVEQKNLLLTHFLFYNLRSKLSQSMQLRSTLWLLPGIIHGVSMIFRQGLASHRSTHIGYNPHFPHVHLHTCVCSLKRYFFIRLARLQDKRDIHLLLSTLMVLSLEQGLLKLLSKFGMLRHRFVLQLFSRICMRWSCICAKVSRWDSCGISLLVYFAFSS